MKRRKKKKRLKKEEVNLEIVKVDSDIERKIATGFIVSTMFCQRVRKMYRPEYIKVDHIRRVINWCLNYFKDFKRAPEAVIKDIFETERENLKEAEEELIDIFLQDISDEYADKKFNMPFVFQKAREYFEQRGIEEYFKEGYQYVRIGEIAKANEVRKKFMEVRDETTERFYPFEKSEVEEYDVKNEANKLFRFDGILGKHLGYFYRTWLLSVLAPEKGTKTFWLEEIAIAGVENGFRVVWYSLEMNKDMLKNRIYRRITKLPDRRKKYWTVPVFDCMYNQKDQCTRRGRKGRKGLLDSNGEKPRFTLKNTYKPCAICRGTKRWWTESWFKSVNKRRMDKDIIQRRVRRYKRKFGKSFVCRSFPAGSVNFDDILEDLEDLELTDGFIPDIVIIDYFDILAYERKVFSERDAVNTTWKRGKNLADVKKCLVVTADQSVKKSRRKRTLDEQDTSEDKRKDAHIDMKIGISQTPQEEEDMVCRVGVIYNRHRRTNKKREVAVLQQLDFANPFLDSAYYESPWRGGGDDE